MNKITEFQGQYRFLSNFWMASFKIGDKEWSSVEHAYQASKSSSPILQDHIRGLPKPGDAKRAGKTISLRHDWEEVKESIMLELVRQKFLQNRNIALQLIQTGDAELIEGNYWHDNTWGQCDCPRCQKTQGKNLLGKILMQVRSELCERSETFSQTLDQK